MLDINDVRMIPVYLDHRMSEFMRAFPDVPDVLRPVYVKAHDAGLMATPPGEATGNGTRWPSGPVMTRLGGEFKDLLESRAQNLFRLGDVLGMWGAVYIATHGQRNDGVFGAFCKLWEIDPRTPEVALWCKMNIEPSYAKSPLYRDALTWLLIPDDGLMRLLEWAHDAAVRRGLATNKFHLALGRAVGDGLDIPF